MKVEPIIAEDGNRYWKDVVSRIFLRLKDKPKSGKQVRCLGGTKRGIWMLTRLENTWMKIDSCWYLNVFVLQNTRLFNFNMCHLSGRLPDSTLEVGYFCPEYPLLKYSDRIHYKSFELQVEIHLEDLAETPELAKQMLRGLKNELGLIPVVVQKELFCDHS